MPLGFLVFALKGKVRPNRCRRMDLLTSVGMSAVSMRYGGNIRLRTYVDYRDISYRRTDIVDMRRMSSGMPNSRVWYRSRISPVRYYCPTTFRFYMIPIFRITPVYTSNRPFQTSFNLPGISNEKKKKKEKTKLTFRWLIKLDNNNSKYQ